MGLGQIPQRNQQRVITGIVTALPEEFNTLTSVRPEKGCCHFVSDKIVIIQSGAGPENAGQCAEKLIEEGRAERLISWGCAGALSPDLGPGNLVLPEQILTEESEILDIRSSWLTEMRQLLDSLNPIPNSSLAASKELIASREQKTALHRITGASALDMESAAIAKVARSHHIDFLAVRAIADPAGMSLPNAVAHALNQDGEVEIAKLLTYLLKHPIELPGLIRLALHFHASRKTLKQAASIWLSSIVH